MTGGPPGQEPAGRDREVAILRDLVDRLVAGRGGAVIIEGPAGIGKTVLGSTLMDLAVQAGVAVHRLPRDPQRHPGPLDEWARPEPAVLLVDDAHALPPAVMESLAALVESPGRLLLALAVRRDEPAAAPEVLDRIRRNAVTTVMRPRPITGPATRTILERHFGEPVDAAFVAACHRACRGNPYLLLELAHALSDLGVPPREDALAAVHACAPTAVADTVDALIRRNDPLALLVAPVVALLDHPATPAQIARLAGLGTDTVVTALATLSRMGLIRPRDNTFVHPIIRRALAARIEAGTRARLHENIALLLHAGGAGPAATAIHLLQAPELLGAEASAALGDAAGRALSEGDVERARPLLERAVRDTFSPTRRAQYAHALAALLHECGDRRALSYCQHAVEVLPPGPDREAAATELVSATAYLQGIGAARVLIHRLTEVLAEPAEHDLLTRLDTTVTLLASGPGEHESPGDPLSLALTGQDRDVCATTAKRALGGLPALRQPSILAAAALECLMYAGSSRLAERHLDEFDRRRVTSAEMSCLRARLALRAGDVQRATSAARDAARLVRDGRDTRYSALPQRFSRSASSRTASPGRRSARSTRQPSGRSACPVCSICTLAGWSPSPPATPRAPVISWRAAGSVRAPWGWSIRPSSIGAARCRWRWPRRGAGRRPGTTRTRLSPPPGGGGNPRRPRPGCARWRPCSRRTSGSPC